jgi:hypothetical protein
MAECVNTEMREQLPELASSALAPADSARVEAHVATCAACTEELEILRAVRATQIPVPFMNVARIVRALPPAPVPVREDLPWYRRASLQMAAALLLVAGGLVSVRQAGNRIEAPSAKVAATAPTGSVEGQAVETHSVASPASAVAAPREAQGTVAAAPPATDIALVAGLDEMTTAELTALLQDVDGLSAVPVAEPEQFSPVTTDVGANGEG